MRIKRPLCAISLAFLCMVACITKLGPPTLSDAVLNLEGKTITLTGKVDDYLVKNNVLQIYLVINRNGESTGDVDVIEYIEGVVVYVNDSNTADYIKIGQMISCKGVFYPYKGPDNEGQFNQMSYYKIRGYDGQLKRARIEGVSRKYSKVSERLRDIRNAVSEILLSHLDEENAGILIAMMLGDKSNLDSEVKDLYQNAGISHLLALSGLHIAAVGLAILKSFRKIGLPIVISSMISGVIITLYAVMTGFSISTQRALIMFCLSIVASCIGRSYDLITAAALSALIIIFAHPYYIYDSGFLLSFLAVVGIGIINPVLQNNLNIISKIFGIKIKSKLVKGLIDTICVSISINIATLPVVASSFYQVSRYSIVLNLIVIPLMSILLLVGFAGVGAVAFGMMLLKIQMTIMGNMTSNNLWPIDEFSKIIFKIAHVILKIYRHLSDFTVGLKGNTWVIGKPNEWQIVIYAILIIVGISAPMIVGKIIAKNKGSDSGKSKITLVFIPLAVFAVLILSYRSYAELEIRNVSVGQGDCALIWGEEVPVIMIDGGSSDIKQVSKYRIVPVLKSNGFNVIDYCVLTHLDMDHISGVLEILGDRMLGIKIRNVIISEASYANAISQKEDNYGQLIDAINNCGSKLLVMAAGDKLTFDSVELTCIHPGAVGDEGNLFMGNDTRNGTSNDISNEPNSVLSNGSNMLGMRNMATDANENSIVLRLDKLDSRNGYIDDESSYYNKKIVFTGLFTGDIGETTEKYLCDSKMLSKVNYLKVAHHGSRYSSTEAFLQSVEPDLAVISVGVNNTYGHPHKETLDRLDEFVPKSRIYRTDECGQVSIVVSGDKTKIRPFIGKYK